MEVKGYWVLPSIVISCAIYSLLFLYILGSKLLRRIVKGKGIDGFTVALVVVSVLGIAITFEALAFLFLDRPLAGRYFFVATVVGVVFAGMSTAGIVAEINAAKWLGDYTRKGLLWGNLLMVVGNVLCFFVSLPSLV